MLQYLVLGPPQTALLLPGGQVWELMLLLFSPPEPPLTENQDEWGGEKGLQGTTACWNFLAV